MTTKKKVAIIINLSPLQTLLVNYFNIELYIKNTV